MPNDLLEIIQKVGVKSVINGLKKGAIKRIKVDIRNEVHETETSHDFPEIIAPFFRPHSIVMRLPKPVVKTGTGPDYLTFSSGMRANLSKFSQSSGKQD
ncbi:Protein Unc-13 B [Manis pentadactyla]|nr:Protein Unc-13 B [Manis pentadactyla]